MAISRPCAHHLDRQRRYPKIWRRTSRAWLTAQPWCAYCLEVGKQVKAVLVDHIRPLARGGRLLDRRNFASCCGTCHNGWVKSMEAGGDYQPYCGADGAYLQPGPITRQAIIQKGSPAALKEFMETCSAWGWPLPTQGTTPPAPVGSLGQRAAPSPPEN